jgi:hypothetical protein
MASTTAARVASFVLVQNTKTGKIYKIPIKYTKCPQKYKIGIK